MNNINARFLIVGINHHYNEELKLKSAERDAINIYTTFNELGLAEENNTTKILGKEVEPIRIMQELDKIKKSSGDILLIYWAGHAEKIIGEKKVVCFTSQTNSKDNINEETISIQNIVQNLNSSKFKKNILILDTCHSGDAIENYEAEYQIQGTVFNILTASTAYESAKESGKGGYLTNILIEEIRKVHKTAETQIDLSSVFSQSLNRLEQEKGQKGQYISSQIGQVELKLNIFKKNTDQSTLGENTDRLETAIGYATKAFRDYLNANIIDGIELIYFLGFDVWDGCLVYDGLINGSIEQQLLEFIRHKFLDRDRLRSRYEEILAKENESNQSQLGIAGQCLKEARICFEKNLKKLINFAENTSEFTEEMRNSFDDELEIPTLVGMRYIGDLCRPKYHSEYPAYDLLLGLRSCLYIPIVESFFEFDILTCSVEEIKQKAEKAEKELLEIKYGRKSLGGVLIAANRKANGLKLNSSICLDRKDSSATDEIITNQIKSYFDDSRLKYQKNYIDFRFYSRCINAIYTEKSDKKIGLRQGLHPSLVKRSIKNVKESLSKKNIHHVLPQQDLTRIILEIANKVEEWRISKILENNDKFPLNCFDSLNNDDGLLEIGTYFNADELSNPQVKDILKTYIIAILWRDLRIKKDIENTLDRIQEYLNNLIPKSLHNQELQNLFTQPTLDKYVSKQIIKRAKFPHDYVNVHPETDEVSKLILAIINDLLDDIRDVNKQTSELVFYYLKGIAPIKKYVNSVSKLEGIFSNSINQRIFCDLSHALSVWLVGLWILEKSSDGLKIKSQVVSIIERYFSSLPEPYNKTLQQTDIFEDVDDVQSLKEDFITIFWGIIAATHDIAVPVQRFQDSCEKFFCQFFGDEAVSQLKKNSSFNIIDVLDHPRFPIYKNAITGLYSIAPKSQNITQRDWLECIFYRALGKDIGHSTISSLILVYELEPYSKYCSEPSMWRMIKRYLQDLSNSEAQRKEFGLFIPAYLAHAVAFSDLPKLQKLWGTMQSGWKTSEQNDSNNYSYFGRTSDEFHISFEEYPLSYLLGLLETILEPSDSHSQLDKRLIKLLKDQNCEDIFGYHSHFFVEDIEIIENQSKTVIYLQLRLWSNNSKQEFKEMTARALKHLYTDYTNKISELDKTKLIKENELWYLYDQKLFDEFKINVTNGTTNENFGEFWDINDKSLKMEKCLSPCAYKVLDMFCRLKDFYRYFKTDQWSVKIKFNNVVDQDNKNIALVFPDDLNF
jgi:Caspase domain